MRLSIVLVALVLVLLAVAVLVLVGLAVRDRPRQWDHRGFPHTQPRPGPLPGDDSDPQPVVPVHGSVAATDPAVPRWHTITRTARWAGAVVALIVVLAVAGLDDLGRSVLLAPLVFAIVLTGAVAVGEIVSARTFHPARRHRREVTLEVRRASALVPAGRRVLAATGVLALVLLTLGTSLLSTPDDLGRVGRTITAITADGTVGVRSPWPGWYYTVPIWIALAVLLVLAASTLRLVSDRPRSGPSSRERSLDDILRRTSAQHVVGLVTCSSVVTALLVAVLAQMMQDGTADGDVHLASGIGMSALAWVGMGSLLVLLVGSVVAAAQLVFPRVRPEARAEAGDRGRAAV